MCAAAGDQHMQQQQASEMRIEEEDALYSISPTGELCM
jgi:hypothetical protein